MIVKKNLQKILEVILFLLSHLSELSPCYTPSHPPFPDQVVNDQSALQPSNAGWSLATSQGLSGEGGGVVSRGFREMALRVNISRARF